MQLIVLQFVLFCAYLLLEVVDSSRLEVAFQVDNVNEDHRSGLFLIIVGAFLMQAEDDLDLGLQFLEVDSVGNGVSVIKRTVANLSGVVIFLKLYQIIFLACMLERIGVYFVSLAVGFDFLLLENLDP